MTKSTTPGEGTGSPQAVDTFPHRHLGPRAGDIEAMLVELGHSSLNALCEAAVPEAIHLKEPMALDSHARRPNGEFALLEALTEMMSENRVMRSCIGMGFSDTIVPPVLPRNIPQNPGWHWASCRRRVFGAPRTGPVLR